MNAIRIGTRGSALALWQAQRVADLLHEPSEIKVVKTSGDNKPDVPLGDKNPTGFFTKEIEKALLESSIDVAVHSLKDLPIEMPLGLVLGAVIERDAAGDVLLLRPDALNTEKILPIESHKTVGASSMRRKALLTQVRPDLEARAIRGNIPTRVSKCISGEYDAVLLSRAGPARLGLDISPLLAFDLNPLWWPGSPGQAAIAVEVRADDIEVRQRVNALEHTVTRKRVELERSLHSTYGGGCHTPFGAYSWISDDSVSVVVAASNRRGTLSLARFETSCLDDTRRVARKWIEGGCFDSNFDPAIEGNWLCRPAQPWC